MAEEGWSFDNPIMLPGGPKIANIARRGDLHNSTTTTEADLPKWHAAIEALMLVVDLGGPTMSARIAMHWALNPH
jgi:hypothetical protein